MQRVKCSILVFAVLLLSGTLFGQDSYHESDGFRSTICECGPGFGETDCVFDTPAGLRVGDEFGENGNRLSVTAPIRLEAGQNGQIVAWTLRFQQEVTPLGEDDFPNDEKYAIKITSTKPIEFYSDGIGNADFVVGQNGVSTKFILGWNGFPEDIMLAGFFAAENDFGVTITVEGQVVNTTTANITTGGGGDGDECFGPMVPVDSPGPEIPNDDCGGPGDEGDDDGDDDT